VEFCDCFDFLDILAELSCQQFSVLWHPQMLELACKRSVGDFGHGREHHRPIHSGGVRVLPEAFVVKGWILKDDAIMSYPKLWWHLCWW
jgi:hypothetical protein